MTMQVSTDVDVAAYLDRIGHPRIEASTEATVATLNALVAAHNRAIPFENLDPLLGTPVADLGPTALFDKLVHRRRGGYCYEHNGLMGFVLEQLGFGVQRLAGRVYWMHTGDAMPAQTHQVLAVTVPGVDGRYLVDVGFGGQTLSSAIRLEPGIVQPTRHEPYRLAEHEDGYLLEALIRDAWRPLYVFADRPQPRIDLEVGSWYVSTHPESGFVVGLTAALVTDNARWNLRGRNLAIHSGGQTDRTRLDTATQVLDILSSRFRIDLTDLGDRSEVHARVAEVLDR